MTQPSTKSFSLTWSGKNLLGMIVLCFIAAGALTAKQLAGRMQWQRSIPQRVEAAGQKIDPNIATAASMRRLLGIGPSKAKAIVAYRNRHGPKAFRSAGDLAKVKGIGPKLIERNLPFLDLPK